MRKTALLLIMTILISSLSFTAFADEKLSVICEWDTKGLKICWNKISGATRYNIKVTRYNNTEKYKIVRNITSLKYTLPYSQFDSLNLNKRYYVTVAAYKGSEKLKTKKVLTADIEIVGHRGCMDKAPQNTLAGLEEAKQSGYDSAEADFYETKSGEILIFHDEFLTKCGAPDVNIRNITKDVIKNYPIIKGKNIKLYETQYIPTIDQYVSRARELGLRLYLHMKDKNNMTDAAIRKIYRTLKKHDMLNRVIVFSSNKAACKRIAQSGCQAGFLLCEPKSIQHEKNAVTYAAKVNAVMQLIRYSEFTEKSVVTLAHKYGLKMGFYRVSTQESACVVKNAGADFLITDEDFLH